MMSMPVAVADRMSAELSAAQQAGLVADGEAQQVGCVRLPGTAMMLSESMMALGAQTHRPVA